MQIISFTGKSNNYTKIYENVFHSGEPVNYAKINENISRSGQPMYSDFKWLKEQGVTDVINFRTMGIPEIDFDEQMHVNQLGMKYHNIPTKTRSPKGEDVVKFVKLVDDIVSKNGKVHIHCFAGADRTGMYSFIYKTLRNMGTMSENLQEWIRLGMHVDRFSGLIPWSVEFVKWAKKYKI